MEETEALRCVRHAPAETAANEMVEAGELNLERVLKTRKVLISRSHQFHRRHHFFQCCHDLSRLADSKLRFQATSGLLG